MTHVRLRLVLVAMTLATWLPARPAVSQTPAPDQAEVQALKAELEKARLEFEAVRQQYEQRLAALEQKLAQLTGTPADAQAAPAPPPAPPPDVAPPAAPVSTAGATSAFAKVFNPDIAVIGNMLGAAGHNPVEDGPALEMSEAEASFQAVVDPYAKADFFIAVGPDGAELEEGFITFNTLPGRFLLKAGKLRANFGKVNTQHSHALAWTDRPLVTRNLVGRRRRPGRQRAVAVAPGDESLVLPRGNRRGLRRTLRAVRGQRALAAHLCGAPARLPRSDRGQQPRHRDVVCIRQHGHRRRHTAQLVGVDATFRYRPLRRAIYSRFQARTELVWSRQDLEDDERSRAFGMYGSAEYQFARRWVGGLRFDRSGRALNGDAIDNGGAFTMTYWPSEFSQVRGEYRLTRYADDVTANEFLFQFLFAIGAHGAHVF